MRSPEGFASSARYCVFVAVTTATEVGVATPSMVAGVCGPGGFRPPPGGGVDAELEPPPQPLARTTQAMANIAKSHARVARVVCVSTETFDIP
jgi:hypothetical protein